jgi:hypothetical protein
MTTNFIRGVALAVAAIAALFATSAWAGEQDFALVNATGYEIGELYVAPAESSDWQEDVLGRDVLADGQHANIKFSRDEDTCRWDLKVVYSEDNTSAEWANVDLCQYATITINYDADSGETSATGE